MPKLNLSSLNVAEYTAKRPPKFGAIGFMKLFFIFGGFIIFLLFLLIALSVLPIFAALLVVALIVFMKVKATIKANKGDRFDKLILDNAWQKDVEVPAEIKSAFGPQGVIFDSKAIQGSFDNMNFWFIHDFGGAAVVIDTNRLLPDAHFMALNLNQGVMKMGLDAMMKQLGLEHISLEGDFDEHFILYAPPEKKLDVLSVVAPDFMDDMLSSRGVGSISLRNRYCLIASNYSTNEDISSLLLVAEKLADELKK